jgi:DNA-binding SARP family transcriptional activator
MPALLETSAHIPFPRGTPISVNARTFGGFSLQVDGRTIPPRDFKAANARWLFLYLLLHEGKVISQDRLREMFWPASSESKGHRALLTSVYRARQALGHSELIERVDQAYRLGRRCRLLLDVKDFLEGHRQVRKSADRATKAQWSARMNALYEGPFVPECTDLWCVKIRLELEEVRADSLRLGAGAECT